MRRRIDKTGRTRVPREHVEWMERRILLANLIANGDFGLGDTGFASDYENSNVPGGYIVGADPQRDYNPLLSSFPDHTTGAGLMLIVDGGQEPGLAVWRQTVPVSPATHYVFSAWAASAFRNPAELAIRINGEPVGETFTLPEEVAEWARFSATWSSGTNTTATIEIVDQNLELLGNDFALDDLSFEAASADVRTYEAEEAAVTGATASAAHPGFTGSGYVDYAHATGDAVEFTVEAPSAARYELSFRYANGGTSPRAMGLAVAGAAVPGGVAFAPTGSWRTWNAAAVTIPLAPENNRVRLVATGQSGPNLDSLSLRRVGPAGAVPYEAEAAKLSGPAAASDVPGYTGSGFADYRHASGDYVEFAIDASADGAYALDFRYANGGRYDRPLDLSVGGQPVARLSFAPTRAWRTWNTTTQSVLLTGGQHTIRLTATGRSGPNLDALIVRPVGASQ